MLGKKLKREDKKDLKKYRGLMRDLATGLVGEERNSE